MLNSDVVRLCFVFLVMFLWNVVLGVMGVFNWFVRILCVWISVKSLLVIVVVKFRIVLFVICIYL